MNMELLIDQFEEQGYVILKGFLEPDCIRQTINEMNKLVDRYAAERLKEKKINDLITQEPFETRLYRLYADHLDDAPKSFREELHLPGLFDLFFHTRLLDVAEQFIGGEIRLYPNYTARPKLPEWEGTRVLWHQDGGYTEHQAGGGAESLESLRMVNIWTPLVPARSDNGCMQFIPGTHRLGVVPHLSRKHYLEISAEYLEPRVNEAVDVSLDPGDIVLFHNLLFHQGQPNRSDSIRWSVDWRYQDARQSTKRKEKGHIARSRSNPESAVQNREEWGQLTWR